MKESYWGYWLIILGIFVIVVMMLINNLTSSNTQDYYLIKEVAESSMIDAVDYAYYAKYKEVKINKEKFVESFVRRFSDSISLSDEYTVSFYEIYEVPPKVSVQVASKTKKFNISGNAESFDIVNKIDAILEADPTK